ncbi:hypothetical protein [Marinicellulosiphila megalodicopiae]|uniref:hypothetical protein n=1 Tax=Marinicellulosiphila megalodicopiae TaxID=2724896 RepID=UPI003BAEF100
MKKILLTAGICSVCVTAMSANIGENFEAGSFQLGGHASFYNNDGETTFRFEPNATFFVSEGVSTGVNFNYRSTNNSNDIKDSYFSLGSSINYTFGYVATAQSGIAYKVGASAYLSKYKYDGVGYDANIWVNPFFRADYFLSPRISVYGVTSPIDFNLTAGENEDFVNTELSFTVGLSYTFARKDIIWDNVSK